MYDDPYSWNIGDPIPRHESHRPLASWSQTITHPNLGKTLLRKFDWDQSPTMSRFLGEPLYGIYEMTETYVVVGTGEIEDVHYHSFLSGELLERVKADFDKYVMAPWKEARKLDKSFPKYTTAKLKRVLDPAIDEQPPGMDFGNYIEVESKRGNFPKRCFFKGRSEKYYSIFGGEIFYRSDGSVGRTECYIMRGERSFRISTTTFISGGDSVLESVYDSRLGDVYKMDKDERAWYRQLALDEAKERREEERERKRAEKERLADEKAKTAQQAEERREEITRFIIRNHGRMTQPQMAEALGLTPKAIQHRIRRLRDVGLLPPYHS